MEDNCTGEGFEEQENANTETLESKKKVNLMFYTRCTL
jgi:hypothetical protein